MVKRIVSFILAAGLAFGAAELPKTGIRVSGHSAAPGQTEFTDYYFDDYGIKYSNHYDGTVDVSMAVFLPDNVTDIVIPSKIKGNKVTSISAEAFNAYIFSECKNIKSITLPDTITSIGNKAFYGCSSLKKIKLSKNLETIGANVFNGTAIESISIPDSVTKIGEDAFAGCAKLKKVRLSSKIKTIPKGMFGDCFALCEITIPKGVTKIDQYAFIYCTNLKKVKLPKTLKVIEDNAFGITNIKTIRIPDGVTTIGKSAFLGTVRKIKQKIIIPASVKSIGEYAVGYNNVASAPYRNEVNPNAVIYCTKGSAAEKYAKENGIKYSTKNLAAASVTGLGAKVYTGKAIKPSPVVKMGSTVLKRKVDYKVTYKANKNIGTAKLTIKGIGNYKGSISKTFKIIPKKPAVKVLTSPKSGQVKAKLKKVKGVSGYQIKLSTSGKFTKKTTKTVNTGKLGKTIGGLKAGSTYYVKVRSYKTVKGKKYYSKYSAVKTVKVK